MVNSLIFDLRADERRESQCRGAVMVMKSGDVNSIALTSKDLALLGVSDLEGLLPEIPVKIDALCGQEIRG